MRSFKLLVVNCQPHHSRSLPPSELRSLKEPNRNHHLLASEHVETFSSPQRFSILLFSLLLGCSATSLQAALGGGLLKSLFSATLVLPTLLQSSAQTEPSSWAYSYGGTSFDYGRSVIESSNGSYIVTGYTGNYGTGPTSLLLAKWLSNGTLSWAKAFGWFTFDIGYSVVEASDGGYVVTGGIRPKLGSPDVRLAKFLSNGTLVWAKTLGGSRSDEGYSVIESSDGGYVITGVEDSYSPGNWGLLLAKLSGNDMESCFANASMNVSDITQLLPINTTIPFLNSTSFSASVSTVNFNVESISLNETLICFSTKSPSPYPTTNPSLPSSLGSTSSPTATPTKVPTTDPSLPPSFSPIFAPWESPTSSPTATPTKGPAIFPTISPGLSLSFSTSLAPWESPTTTSTLTLTKSPTTSTTSEGNLISATGDTLNNSFVIVVAGGSMFLVICSCSLAFYFYQKNKRLASAIKTEKELNRIRSQTNEGDAPLGPVQEAEGEDSQQLEGVDLQKEEMRADALYHDEDSLEDKKAEELYEEHSISQVGDTMQVPGILNN